MLRPVAPLILRNWACRLLKDPYQWLIEIKLKWLDTILFEVQLIVLACGTYKLYLCPGDPLVLSKIIRAFFY